MRLWIWHVVLSVALIEVRHGLLGWAAIAYSALVMSLVQRWGQER